MESKSQLLSLIEVSFSKLEKVKSSRCCWWIVQVSALFLGGETEISVMSFWFSPDPAKVAGFLKVTIRSFGSLFSLNISFPWVLDQVSEWAQKFSKFNWHFQNMMTFDKLLTFSTYSDNLTGVEQLRSISFAFFFRKLMCLLIDVGFF